MPSIIKASLFIVLSSASVAFAQTPIPLTVSGNQVQGRFELPGGISGDLTITLESADGLTPTALEASASLESPLDPALLARLPGLVSVPQFMIVIDNRPIDTVIAGKFDGLQATLNNYAALMPPTVVSALQTFLSQARTLYQSGDTLGAIGQMTSFSDYVKAHSGTDIPDVWRANDPNTVNVAGLLRSGADTLKFSLDRKTSS